jgi:hypothetical protein
LRTGMIRLNQIQINIGMAIQLMQHISSDSVALNLKFNAKNKLI